MPINFLVEFIAGKTDFFGVNYYYTVAMVRVRSEIRRGFSRQYFGGLGGKPSQHPSIRIKQSPPDLTPAGLRQVSRHSTLPNKLRYVNLYSHRRARFLSTTFDLVVLKLYRPGLIE